MMYPQMTPNASQIHPIHVHLQCLTANIFRVALPLWFWSVLSVAVHATVPLTTSLGFACFILSFCSLTIWTCLHSTILAQYSIHSLNVFVNKYIQSCLQSCVVELATNFAYSACCCRAEKSILYIDWYERSVESNWWRFSG